MSTYLYLQCLSHLPRLSAEGNSGSHLQDLDEIREDIKNRDKIVEAVRAEGEVYQTDQHRRATAWFFLAHPKCQLGIRDEYGKWHAIVPDNEEHTHEWNVLTTVGTEIEYGCHCGENIVVDTTPLLKEATRGN